MGTGTAQIALNRRSITTILAALAVITLFYTFSRNSQSSNHLASLKHTASTSTASSITVTDSSTEHAVVQDVIAVSQDVLKGEVISGKIENATAKAELGRAGWKILHTTMAKFPDRPTPDEQTALLSYVHLFARLYPCGECAGHFQQILAKFPPQVSTRSNAAAWACHVHNVVNKSLQKSMFDCSKIGDFYDCGCADEEGDKPKSAKGESDAVAKAGSTAIASMEESKAASKKGDKIDLVVERNGPTKGG